MRLEETNIIVTGAAHDIGQAMAGGFVSEDALERAGAGFEGPGGAISLTADVRSWVMSMTWLSPACTVNWGPSMYW